MCVCVCVYIPSLSLSSGIFFSVSRTAGITWSYMCSRGLQLSEKLPWCSSSQWSRRRHSLSRDAAGPHHHGGSGPEEKPSGKKSKMFSVFTVSDFRDRIVNNSYCFRFEMQPTYWVCQLMRTSKIQPLTMENDHHCLNQLREWETEECVKRCKTRFDVLLKRDTEEWRVFYLSVTLTAAVQVVGPASCCLSHQSAQQANQLRHKINKQTL